MVTATGDVVRVDEAKDPELFWGMRGNGASFGIVTEFVLKLRDMPNNGIIRSAPILWGADKAKEVMTPWLGRITRPERKETETLQFGFLALTLPPVSARASARARPRASICIPSTLDEAIDSVRRSRRARGARTWATAFSSRIAFSASDMTPVVRASKENWIPPRGSGRNAWYRHALRYFGGA